MDWKGKTSLVTGGSGFIGTHLTDELLRLGSDVILVDSVEPSNREGNIEILKLDISKDLNISRDVDYIFHLAAVAYPKTCNENPRLAFDVNVKGTFNMLMLAKEKNVKKFVFPSSAQVYGRYPEYLPVDEKHPVEHRDNFYNTTKFMGENLCMGFSEKYGLPTVFFRLFNSFGPGQGYEYLIPTIIKQALSKGEIEFWNDKPTRDFTYVTDTVRAFLMAAQSDFRGGPINIGSGKETPVGDIAKQIAGSLGAKISFLDKEVIGSMRMLCNNTKAFESFGWKPEVSFEEGLEKTINWFKSSQTKP